MDEKDVIKKKLCPPTRDLTNFKPDAFEIIEYVGKHIKGDAVWRVKCKLCGRMCLRRSYSITKGNVKSCGCISHKHEDSRTRLYRIWRDMKRRCYDKTRKCYINYGKRGISVCDEWKNSYIHFSTWAKSNGYEDNLTIERIDNNGNYCPENCKWVDKKQQNRNRRCTIFITINGETKPLGEWAEISGISHTILRKRYIVRKWPVERLFDKPDYDEIEVTIKGETKTIAQWSKESGIPYNTLLVRYKKPHYPNELLLEKPKEKKKLFEFNGEKHTLKEWAKITGIGYVTLCHRLKNPDWPNEYLLLPKGNHIKKWLKDRESKNS